MFKAAFFDIDGTLLSFTTHQVSPGTIVAFDILHRLGIRTFISSGRPSVLIPPMPVSFDAYITMNGGYVYSGDEVLLSRPIPDDETAHWVDYARENNLCTMSFTQRHMFVSNVNNTGLAIRNQLEFPMPPVVPIERLLEETSFQLIAVMPPERDAEVQELLPHCRLPRWHPVFTDVIHKDSSKAVGMEAVCRRYGFHPEETIAFGDGGNDVEMLQWAGLGIAMGNAAPDVQAVADYVTTSVDDEGILNAINHLIVGDNHYKDLIAPQKNISSSN